MKKYIITFEDGQHYLANKIEDTDLNSISEGYITVIRCSDFKELDRDLNWIDLQSWNK